jgi:hypothetical protein
MKNIKCLLVGHSYVIKTCPVTAATLKNCNSCGAGSGHNKKGMTFN